MPVTVNTPFGQRTQSDPRDAVAQRNFAIMQQLAQLQGGRDIAQIEANARMQAADREAARAQNIARIQADAQRQAMEYGGTNAQNIAQIEANARMQAAEQDANRSQAWAQLQQRMQADKLAQEQAMFQQRLGAEDSRFDRRTSREDEIYAREQAALEDDPTRQLQRRLAEMRMGALTDMPSTGTDDLMLNPITGEISQRPLPQPDFVAAAAVQPGNPAPFGDTETGALRPVRALGNYMFGDEPADPAPLQAAYNAVRQQLERDGYSGEENIHNEAVRILRKNGITDEQLRALYLIE